MYTWSLKNLILVLYSITIRRNPVLTGNWVFSTKVLNLKLFNQANNIPVVLDNASFLIKIGGKSVKGVNELWSDIQKQKLIQFICLDIYCIDWLQWYFVCVCVCKSAGEKLYIYIKCTGGELVLILPPPLLYSIQPGSLYTSQILPGCKFKTYLSQHQQQFIR